MSRETPKSELSCRSDGIASPTASCSTRSRTRSRVADCFVVTRCITNPASRLVNTRSRTSADHRPNELRLVRVLEREERRAPTRDRRSETELGRPPAAPSSRLARSCADRPVQGEPRSTTRSAPSSASPSSVSTATRVASTLKDVSVRTELLEHDDLASRVGSADDAKAASSNASGRMPRITRRPESAELGRRRSVEWEAELSERDLRAVDRRLDEIHRRRSDEARATNRSRGCS